MEKFNSWSDVDPTKITPEEEPEKEPLKRYTQDELMAMEHAELVKMYIRLQEEGCREPEPKKVNSYDRRKSGEREWSLECGMSDGLLISLVTISVQKRSSSTSSSTRQTR